jgi:hypothetical protein
MHEGIVESNVGMSAPKLERESSLALTFVKAMGVVCVARVAMTEASPSSTLRLSLCATTFGNPTMRAATIDVNLFITFNNCVNNEKGDRGNVDFSRLKPA